MVGLCIGVRLRDVALEVLHGVIIAWPGSNGEHTIPPGTDLYLPVVATPVFVSDVAAGLLGDGVEDGARQSR